MNRLSVRILLVTHLFMLGLPCVLADDDKNAAPQNMREKYAIPERLQKEDMEIILRRMEWFINTARAENWQSATQHPSRRKENNEWNGTEVIYVFRNHPQADGKFLRDFRIWQGVGSGLVSDSRFNGTIYFSPNGKPRYFRLPLCTITFGENDNSGTFDFPWTFRPDSNIDLDISVLESLDGIDNVFEWDSAGNMVFDIYEEKGYDVWDAFEATICEDYFRELQPWR